jgi:hypothetical protein
MKPHSNKSDINTTLGNTSIDKVRVNSIDTRLRLLIWSQYDSRDKFAYLESHTKIKSATWRSWWTRGDTPNGNLVEGAAKVWPRYAFWLATGITDVRCGHDMPRLHPSAQGYIDNMPEEATKRSVFKHTYSKEYFERCLAIYDPRAEKTLLDSKLNMQILVVASKGRLKEIESNFAVPLLFDDHPLL